MQAFESLGLIVVMLCIVAEVYMDFLSKPSPDRRLVELLALLAGMNSLFLVFIVLPDDELMLNVLRCQLTY